MNEEDITILVDFNEPGLQQVGIMEKDAREAIKKALGALGWIADRSRSVIHNSIHRPDEAEIEFGIKVGTKAGILVAQGNVDAHIKAKLIWKNLDSE